MPLVRPHFTGPYKAVRYTDSVLGIEAANGVNVGACDVSGKVLFIDETGAHERANMYNALWPSTSK
jgi:hypothetical protein